MIADEKAKQEIANAAVTNSQVWGDGADALWPRSTLIGALEDPRSPPRLGARKRRSATAYGG